MKEAIETIGSAMGAVNGIIESIHARVRIP